MTTSLGSLCSGPRSAKADNRGKRLDLFGVARHRVYQKMVGAHCRDFFKPFAHLLRCAMDPRGVGAGGVMVDLAEPLVQLGAGALRALVDRHEQPLRDRKAVRVAPDLLKRGAQQRHRLLERGDARSARPHPAIGEPSGPAYRIGVADAKPDRQRLLDRFWLHRRALDAKNLAVIINAGLTPQGADEFDPFAKAPHPPRRRYLELGVVMGAAEPHPEDRAAAAQLVETGPLMGDMGRVMSR